jgi:hypothetical protein
MPYRLNNDANAKTRRLEAKYEKAVRQGRLDRAIKLDRKAAKAYRNGRTRSR